MSEPVRLALQVLASAALVITVLVVMWKLPRRGESLFGFAPPLALISAWGGLLALIASTLLWIIPATDLWLVVVLLLLDPGAIAAGVLVLWIYRGYEATEETIEMQRLQARVGISLGLLAVAIGYSYVMLHKQILTPVGG